MGESDEAPLPMLVANEDSSSASTREDAQTSSRGISRDPLGTLVHQVCCPMRPSLRNNHRSHLTFLSTGEADRPPRALFVP